MPKYIDYREVITLDDIDNFQELYLKRLNKPNIDFYKFDFFINYIDNMSLQYFISKSFNKGEKSIPNIFYKTSKLHISNNNFLFLKFLKFHLGYLNYIEAFKKHDLSRYLVSSQINNLAFLGATHRLIGEYRKIAQSVP